MLLYVFISIAVVLLDQLSKILITSHFSLYEEKTLIEGVLSFTYIQNKGAAFGMLSGARVFFIVITVLAFLLGWIYFKKNPMKNIFEKLGISFIAGGAVGNLIDRAFLGYVRDFISADFIDFPIFNVADCFVCVGAAIYILCILLEKNEGKSDE